MRGRPVSAGGLVALVVVLALSSCKPFKDDSGGGNSSLEAGATFPPPPNRQVVDDGGLIGVGGSGGAGGTGAMDDGSAPPPRDAPAPADKTVERADTAPDAAAPRADGDSSCNLLVQDCGLGQGCYPASAGMGGCKPSDNLPMSAPCSEVTMCAPGLTCEGGTCVPLCSTAQANCPGGGRCAPLPAYTGVGFCAP